MNYQFSNKINLLQPSVIREILKFTSDPKVIPFAAGNPAPEAFPAKEIAEITTDIFNVRPIEALQYSITEGYTPLRNTLKDYMKKEYNSFKDFDELIITAGAQQVVELTSKILANEGDTVICESPTFIGSLNAFRSYNLNIAGIDMDDDGINLEKLENALKTQKNVRFIYVIPNFQNPSGITMSKEKRINIYKLAQKYNVMILEDNPYGEIRFDDEQICTIKSLDTDGRVIYAGSFSKILSPGMRVGFAIAPKEVCSKLIVAKQVSDVHTNILAQLIAEQFMNKYDFAGHLAENRIIYKKKFDLMTSMLDRRLPASITYIKPKGGIFIWCTLPKSVNMLDFCKKAVEERVAVVPGSAFLTDESLPCHNFRINFSTPRDDQLAEGVEILGNVAKQFI